MVVVVVVVVVVVMVEWVSVPTITMKQTTVAGPAGSEDTFRLI
jgi:hypothetical protein